MKITVATVEAQKGFYPTPPALADQLVADINWCKIKRVLEPSVGTGNLLRAIGRAVGNDIMNHENRILQRSVKISVDMVEIDPALRGIVKDTFLCADHDLYWNAYMAQEKETIRRTDAGESEDSIQESKKMEDDAYAMYFIVERCPMRFVHEDFMAFNTMESYDLIVMNPPFADGDAHLLKAIMMQERYGGMIRCILNAETLRNPCTNRRKVLVQKLRELNADITYQTEAFADAERSTDVEVAIIKLDIPSPHKESEFYNRFHRAEERKRAEGPKPTELTVADRVEAVVSQYRVEVNAGIALIEEYVAMKPYILTDICKSDYNLPILALAINSSHADRDGNPDINEFIRVVRLKYWRALFMNKEIFGQYTSNLQDELRSRVDEMSEFEFDVYNIRLLIAEMNARMCDGVKETILNLFQQMTVGYHWRDDPCVENIHYYNGWATNKAHYINKKVILPCYGVFPDYSWSKDTIKVYDAYKKLIDIEKALNYLDGNMTADVDLYSVLQCANNRGQSRNISCKYFDVTFYKKGTMHIKFTNQELLDRFNIFCGREKNWLPPSYGRKQYNNMDDVEKAVVDSFHGDSTPGSGEKAYEKVLAKADYYLAPATQSQLALPAMSA